MENNLGGFGIWSPYPLCIGTFRRGTIFKLFLPLFRVFFFIVLVGFFFSLINICVVVIYSVVIVIDTVFDLNLSEHGSPNFAQNGLSSRITCVIIIKSTGIVVHPSRVIIINNRRRWSMFASIRTRIGLTISTIIL